MKKRVDERDGGGQGRSSMGSDFASSHAEAQGCRTWTPTIIHWRGWSPYGNDAARRLTRSEAEDSQRQIGDQLPQQLWKRLRWLRPLVRDHSVSAEVLAPAAWEAKDIADRSNLELGKSPIDVKGKQIRAACGTSPHRRMAVSRL